MLIFKQQQQQLRDSDTERRTGCEMFLFLILMLQFTLTEQLSSVTVRDGDDVTLTCHRVKDKCQNSVWFYNNVNHDGSEALVRHGRVESSRSLRLRVGEKCSLVITKVTAQDAGLYTCRQDGDSEVYLSVVSLTEHERHHQIDIYCEVSTHKSCEPSVKWLQDKVSVGHRDQSASQTRYYATVSVEASQSMNSLTCEVTDCSSNVHQFPLRRQASGRSTKLAATESTGTFENSTLNNEASAETQGLSWWWWLLAGAVSSAALVVVAIAVKRCQRGDGRKAETKEKADAEDGLCYASVSFTQSSSTNAQIGDGGDAVTYSCVNSLR